MKRRVTLNDYDRDQAEAEAALLALGSLRRTTELNVRERDYTFVCAAYDEPTDDPLYVRGTKCRWVRFIVGTPFKAEAMQRARTYLLAFGPRGLGEPREIDLYPRNYIDDARLAFAQRRHD